MKKLFSILALTVLFTAFAVTQTSDGFAKENVGITDSDCKNFAKNYKKIQKALEDLNEKYDEGAIPAGTELDTYNKAFSKNGISGPNEYYKVLCISNAYSIYAYELELDSDRLTKAVMKKGKMDPMASLKATIGKDDYEAVKANYKAIAKAVGDTPVEPEKKKDTTFGDIIGDALGGGKKGSTIGKGVDSFVKKKGKSEKVADHLEEDDE